MKYKIIEKLRLAAAFALLAVAAGCALAPQTGARPAGVSLMLPHGAKPVAGVWMIAYRLFDEGESSAAYLPSGGGDSTFAQGGYEESAVYDGGQSSSPTLADQLFVIEIPPGRHRLVVHVYDPTLFGEYPAGQAGGGFYSPSIFVYKSDYFDMQAGVLIDLDCGYDGSIDFGSGV